MDRGGRDSHPEQDRPIGAGGEALHPQESVLLSLSRLPWRSLFTCTLTFLFVILPRISRHGCWGCGAAPPTLLPVENGSTAAGAKRNLGPRSLPAAACIDSLWRPEKCSDCGPRSKCITVPAEAVVHCRTTVLARNDGAPAARASPRAVFCGGG